MNVQHWIDDDNGYEAWLIAHPEGYVANINNTTPITHRYLKIHRASHHLPDRSNPSSVNPRTGNHYAKVTSESRGDLLEWIRKNGYQFTAANLCKTCSPFGEGHDAEELEPGYSKSKKAVVETAVDRDAICALEEINVPDFFNPHDVEDARRWINASIVRRQGQGKFRADVLAAYGNRCAISTCDVSEALEAAHIFGYLGIKTNVVTNGLLLRGDLHTLYDLGLIAIDSASMQVLIAPRLKGTDYGHLAGTPVRLPEKVEHRPNLEALKLHADWSRSKWLAASETADRLSN